MGYFRNGRFADGRYFDIWPEGVFEAGERNTDSEGKVHQKGTRYYADGEVESGLWLNGVY